VFFFFFLFWKRAVRTGVQAGAGSWFSLNTLSLFLAFPHRQWALGLPHPKQQKIAFSLARGGCSLRGPDRRRFQPIFPGGKTGIFPGDEGDPPPSPGAGALPL